MRANTSPIEHRKWLILFIMTASLSMIFIDMTVLPVALPTLNRELNFSVLSFQWVINIYTLTLTVFALAGGRLAHMLGLKNAFCIGLIIFAVASALCGLSNTSAEMIIARMFQGVGASIMVPSHQAIILEVFPAHQRGKAQGLFISFSSIFLAIGPLVGGSLTQYLSWRYIFWVNIPIAMIGMIFAWAVVPHFKKIPQSFDWFGFFTLGAGVTSIMIGIMQAPLWGWKSPLTLFLLFLGICLIVFLYHAESQHPHPFFDISLIRNRNFIGGSLAIFCNAFLLMVTVYWAIFFQEILEYTPSHAGSLSSFSTLPVVFFAPLAGYLVDRYGPRLPVILGFSLIILSLSFFLLIVMHHVLWMLLVSLFFFGISMPFIYTPSYLSLMHDVPSEKRGIVSGMNITLRQFSSTLGLAIFSAVFYQWYYLKFTHSLENTPLKQSIDPHRFEGLLLGNPQALKAINALPEDTAAFIEKSMISSIICAFDLINCIAIAVAALGLCIALRFLRNHSFTHGK